MYWNQMIVTYGYTEIRRRDISVVRTEFLRITPARRQLEELFSSREKIPAGWTFPGVSIYKIFKEPTSLLQDCYWYVFGKGSICEHLDELFEKGTSTPMNPGSVAVYLDRGLVKHVGIVSKSGTIVSKWGTSHAFSHDFNTVPIVYGDKVIYFAERY
jgi:hypothetical protein